VEFALKAALALNCSTSQETKFDRKHYFYPDLVKGYQISQSDQPIGSNGYLEFEIAGATRCVGIRRVHLEEDTGKMLHDKNYGHSYIDYNRSGVPLLEIVTEPELCSPAEAKAFLQALRELMEYLEISDCRIEEGSMRCEANISIRQSGSTEYGTLNEIKNIGSFTGVERALEYEIMRQTELMSAGEAVRRQTRRWNEHEQRTEVMRHKEEAEDYRYIGESDLVPLQISPEWVEVCRQELPELPQQRRQRYMRALDLSPNDAAKLASHRPLAQYFETVVGCGIAPKLAANWLLTDMRRVLNQSGLTLDQSRLKAEGFAELMALIAEDYITTKTAKDVLEYLVQVGGSPKDYVQQNNLLQLSRKHEIMRLVKQAIVDNPKAVIDYLAGKEKALATLVGVVMKASGGKANPELVNELLREEIKKT